MSALSSPEDSATVQAFGALARVRIGLSEAVRHHGVSGLNQLLEAHEVFFMDSRPLVRGASGDGDDGTNDRIVSQVVRLNELQRWFVGEHLESRSSHAT
jgi:hypothetical protein